jgi:hypothetical protein
LPRYIAGASSITGHLSRHPAFRLTGREIIVVLIVVVACVLILVMPVFWGAGYDTFSRQMDRAAKPVFLVGFGVLVVGLVSGVRILDIAGGAVMGAVVLGKIAEHYLTPGQRHLPMATRFRTTAGPREVLRDREQLHRPPGEHEAVSTAYTASSWTVFGESVATAAAALVGLLFIAVSINLKQILDVPHLPSRAAQTLILFATPLVSVLLVIVPGQGRAALGAELLAAGLVIGGIHLRLDLAAEHGPGETIWRRMIGRIIPGVLSSATLAVAGATLIAAAGGGLYWLVPSVLAALIFGLVNVWVLLVEILR